MSLTRNPSLKTVAVFSMATLGAFTALAAPVQQSSSGDFSNPLPAEALPFAFITDLGDDSLFEWGNPTGGLVQSFLLFTHLDALSTGATFSVGTLDWFNGESAGGTGASSVDFALGLTFDLSPGTHTESLDFRFLIANIPNDNLESLAHPDNADALEFEDASKNFFIDGTEYSLTLSFAPIFEDGMDGYGPVGFLDGNRFRVREGFTASANLNATFVQVGGTPVPDGGTTLVLLGSAIASLSFMRRQRR